MKFTYAKGATPIDPNEQADLIPSDISTQSQLNNAEQKNIVKATAWFAYRKHKNILNEPFIKLLHKKMLEDVWRWAGRYRNSDKNIGVFHLQILPEIQKLIDDTTYWIENQTYSWVELGTHFHHRLVSIHPFPNGNGRHARLMTEILLKHYQQPIFTWGATTWPNHSLTKDNPARKAYLNALKLADKRRFDELIKFVQS